MASMLAGRVSHLSIATPIVTDDMMREGGGFEARS